MRLSPLLFDWLFFFVSFLPRCGQGLCKSCSASSRSNRKCAPQARRWSGLRLTASLACKAQHFSWRLMLDSNWMQCLLMIHQWSCWFVMPTCITCSALFCIAGVHGANPKRWNARCCAHMVYFSQNSSVSQNLAVSQPVTSLHSITVLQCAKTGIFKVLSIIRRREELSAFRFFRSVEKRLSKSEWRVVFLVRRCNCHTFASTRFAIFVCLFHLSWKWI